MTRKFLKSGPGLYRGRKRVDGFCRPNGMVYKREGFLRHFGHVAGDSWKF